MSNDFKSNDEKELSSPQVDIKNSQATNDLVAEENKFVKSLKKIGVEIKYYATRPKTKYVLKRILNGIVTIILIASVVFLLLRMLPRNGFFDDMIIAQIRASITDPLQREAAVQNYIDSINRMFGFDQPLMFQLWEFLKGIIPIPFSVMVDFHTDQWDITIIHATYERRLFFLGISNVDFRGETVSSVIADRFGISMFISLTTTFFTYLIAYPLGVLMAKNKGKTIDKVGNGFIVLNLAIPTLVFYLILWQFFNRIGLGGRFLEEDMITIIPPIIALTLVSIPAMAMWVRRFMVDEGDADYVKFARSKGLSETKIMFTHVFRNALVPLIRNLPTAFIGAIIGSYFIEDIWGIPGTGRILIDAMRSETPDLPLVQGLVVVYSAISILAFLLGDLITSFADPRIKLH